MQLSAAKSDVDELKKKVDAQALIIAGRDNSIQSLRYALFLK